MPEHRHAIEAQVVLLSGAQASVTLPHLSDLLARAERYVEVRRETYERRFERIGGAEDTAYYLADAGHWDRVGGELGFDDREADAVRRSHAAQFRRDGRRLDRTDEFETSLEIRDVVATPASRSSR
jgi:hypothetical protein